MFITALLRPRLIASIALALVIGSSAYGFAAANTLPKSGLGDSDEAISGYTITNVQYTLDETSNPADIDSVSFDIAPTTNGHPDATDVKVQLTSGGPLFDCTVGGTTTKTATCTITGVTAEAATTLRVIAQS
jgi:hypothetical protein